MQLRAKELAGRIRRLEELTAGLVKECDLWREDPSTLDSLWRDYVNYLLDAGRALRQARDILARARDALREQALRDRVKAQAPPERNGKE